MISERENRRNEKIRRLILEYRRKNQPTLLRNFLFNVLRKDLDTIVRGILSKRGRYLDQGEILSLTWQVYIWFLDKYKEEYPPLPMLRRWTGYFLMGHFNEGEKARMTVSLEEALEDGQHHIEGVEYPADFSNVEELMSFRDVCDDREKYLFDFALTNSFIVTQDDFDMLRSETQLSHFAIRSFLKMVRKFIVPFTTGRQARWDRMKKQKDVSVP